ncbi:MAG TPA: dethiobiotin synthase [Chryseosolibacter sp.]
MHNYFVTAIDTDSGKTLVSAILCEALQADYWKPIQAGLPRDSDRVNELISHDKTFIHPERYLLKTPASPHASAKIDKIEIQLNDFKLPKTNNNLIVEGAGGCLVPINDKHFVIDIIKHLSIEVILVADLYLGSINHTLLTVEALNSRSIAVKGIIFNGESNPESERIILQHSQLTQLLRIDRENKVDKEVVSRYASSLRKKLNEIA